MSAYEELDLQANWMFKTVLSKRTALHYCPAFDLGGA
jgi:hypothetical protein